MLVGPLGSTLNHTWKERRLEGPVIEWGAVHCYKNTDFGDTTRHFLRAAPLRFNPLYITVLNFIEGTHREPIAMKQAMLAFLLVTYEANGVHGLRGKVQSMDKKYSVAEKLQVLHESAEYTLKKPLSSSLLRCFAISFDRCQFSAHIIKHLM